MARSWREIRAEAVKEGASTRLKRMPLARSCTGGSRRSALQTFARHIMPGRRTSPRSWVFRKPGYRSWRAAICRIPS